MNRIDKMTGELKKPELLAPAGDMERLKAAVKYKADAVYLGGSVFGMRTAPENFGEEQLKKSLRLLPRKRRPGVPDRQHPAEEQRAFPHAVLP